DRPHVCRSCRVQLRQPTRRGGGPDNTLLVIVMWCVHGSHRVPFRRGGIPAHDIDSLRKLRKRSDFVGAVRRYDGTASEMTIGSVQRPEKMYGRKYKKGCRADRVNG